MDGTTPKRRRAPETRREEILQAASRLFGEQGYERTTTKQIAQAAGIAEGTIYKYFASKQELLFAFLESSVIEPLNAIISGMTGAPDEEVFATVILNRLDLWHERHEFVKVNIAEAFFNPQLAALIHEKLFRGGTRAMEQFVRGGIADGRFRDIDPGLVLRAVVGALFAFSILRDITGPDPHTREEQARELARFFLHGLRAPQPVEPPVTPLLPLALLW